MKIVIIIIIIVIIIMIIKARLWSMRNVEIIPVVVGALGAVSKQFEAYVEVIGIKMNIEHAQKTALLGSARILRLVLDIKGKGERNMIP